MGNTSIEWTDCTWNPVRGCSRVSEGCRNCYAEQIAARFSGAKSNPMGSIMKQKDAIFAGYAIQTPSGPRWTGKVELIESKLEEPLHWKKPRRVFVNSMSDLFHENLSDWAIERVFAVMAICPQHTFQILTKRAERMQKWFQGDGRPRWDHIYNRAYGLSAVHQLAVPAGWPLPNVWLGVSVENQQTADERIPLLLQTPAAIRFVSYEPALGPVDFMRWLYRSVGTYMPDGSIGTRPCLDWIIVGGESGPGARKFNLNWARDTIRQCSKAGVPVFVKQVGSWPLSANPSDLPFLVNIKGKGGDWEHWPPDLRIRQFPVIDTHWASQNSGPTPPARP